MTFSTIMDGDWRAVLIQHRAKPRRNAVRDRIKEKLKQAKDSAQKPNETITHR